MISLLLPVCDINSNTGGERAVVIARGRLSLYFGGDISPFKIGSSSSKRQQQQQQQQMDGGKRWRWKQVFRYSSRCVCFGCKDQQLTTYVEEEEINDGEDTDSRRGGISYQRTDKKALYVRMLGDVKAQTKPEMTHDQKKARRKTSLQPEAKLLDRLDCSAAKRARLTQRRLSSCSSSGDSTGCGTRSKRASAAAASMSKDCANLLDVQYMTLAMKCLSSLHKWNFNVFTLDLLTDGRSLFHMSLQLFFNCGFIEVFQLDVVRLMRCLALIESGYYISNPYHNSVHAADVVQAMYCSLLEPKISRHLTVVEKMAAVVAAASHDLDHPGVNQAFLIATSNPLASLYNNVSVLENHHWHAMIGILHESRVFEHFDRKTWNEVLSLTQSMILATDITRQQEILGLFRDHLQRDSLDLESSSVHRSFILQITLKCADICNPCRPWLLSKRWSEMICEEFFRQGDCERKLNLPVAPFYDRYKSSVAAIQTGFMTNVVEPLFVEWNRFLGSSLTTVQLNNLRCNKLKWEDIVGTEKRLAQTVTVIACTETVKSEDAEIPPAPSDDCSAELEVLVDDKENANPVLNDTEILDIITNQLGINGHRRHSLPMERISDELGSNELCAAMQGRRHSLPNCCGTKGEHCSGTTARRLSSLVECSPVGDDHFDFDKNSNVRHISHEESKNPALKAGNPDACGGSVSIGRRRSDVVRVGLVAQEGNGANRRRASCPLNVINQLRSISNTNCSSPESGCPRRQTSWFVAPVAILRPSKRVTDCGMSRKFSLTSAADTHNATSVDRKRSRSLATSTLLYPVDENMSRLKSLISNTSHDTHCWQQPETAFGLLTDSYLATSCHGNDRINHFITSSKSSKPPVLSVKTNARYQAENFSGIEAFSGDRVMSSGVKVGQGQTFQVLSSRPVMSRSIDVHSRPPKGVTRKATSVFTSVSDGEVVPLLAKRVDLHSCDDDA